MNWPKKLLLVLAISVTTAFEGMAQSPTFFIVAPNVFRVGVEEKVVVSLLKPPAPNLEVAINLYLKLPGSTSNFAEQNVNVRAGSPESVFFNIEPGNLARNEGRFQHVVLGARSLNQNYPFEKEEEVLVTFQAGFVFVQTDKPIYTPNQKVTTRVISLDQGMRPSDRTLHVEVKNPEGISVTRFKNTQATNGFLTGDFQFSSRPMFGIWSVTAFYGHQFLLNSTVTFEVKEYVLPTFSVKVTPPKYILEGTNFINTSISAQYVFRKPVIGSYLFKFGVVDTQGTVSHLGERRGSLDRHGEAHVNLTDLDNVLGANWFDRYMGYRFRTEAIVFEAATSFSEAAINTTATFVSSPYKFSASRTVHYFKKALTMRIKLDLMYANGAPAPGIPVRVSAVATLSNGQEQQLAGANVAGALNVNQQAVSNTDENGRRDFLLGVPPDAVSIQIQCSTEDEDFANNQAFLSFEVEASESPNNADNLVIVTPNQAGHKLTVGEDASFVVQRTSSPGEAGVDLHFMCVTAGKIVMADVEENVGNNPVLGPFVINQDMVPSTRLVAYYVTSGGHVIADSILLEVEERCAGELSLNILPERRPPLPTSYNPNEQVQVQVQAPANSHVGLLAVDKAIYLLRNKDRLTKQKMFHRMKSFDTGCGPGGGQTTAQTFKDSGMTVLTNALLDVDTRQGIGCDEPAQRRKRSIDQDCLTDEIRSCLNRTGKANIFNHLRRNVENSCNARLTIIAQNCNINRREKQAFKICCENAGRNVFFAMGRGVENELPDGMSEDVPVRDDFRETWFFDLIDMPENGEYRHVVSTPSSITEWQLTAVSVSPTLGMCVADNTAVHVFKNFFIQLHLPYSVVKSEQTEIVVTVFNYGYDDMEVNVNFTVPEGLCSAENPAVRKIAVPMENAASAIFIVRPIEVGEFPITVSAGPGRRIQDVVRKNLRVVPQGKTVRRGRSVTLNPRRIIFEEEGHQPTQAPVDPNIFAEGVYGENSQTEVFQVSLPEDSIPDTQSCNVNLIGDLLGTIVTDPINNLERLVRKPSGCGEQTMIRLAPTLFVYKYLHAIDADTADLEERIYDYLGDGIQRELTYRQNNGAYAAWTHRPGSTWLTAFVVKIFSQASPFTHVDAGHVIGSINWLIGNQQDTGVFNENHAVIHQEMIGAVRGDISRTAYVLISFLESRNLLIDSTQRINDAILKATQYLEGQLDNLVRVYDKAIVAYALALAGSGSKSRANDILKESANVDGDSGAVNFDPDPQNYGANPPFWLHRRSSAISVETTAYALLAQMVIGDYDYAGRIAIWLSQQQNYDGGFVSTQDTVVALQALAKYAERPAFHDIDMSCDVAYEGFHHSRHITTSDARVQSEVDVTESIGKDLQIRSTGQGVAKANVELQYNTKQPDGDTCTFSIDVVAAETDNGEGKISRLDITVCTRYKDTSKTTHMSIIDVGLYSGFSPVIQDLKEITNSSDYIASYEISDRSVIFYCDKIPSDEDLCFTFRAKSDSIVGNVQAVAVNVYDYYDPDESCTIFYQPGNRSPLLTTLCSENECICSSRATSYCATVQCGEEYTSIELENSACANQGGYALKIGVTAEAHNDGFNIYNFTVDVPIKPGEDNVVRGDQRQLYIDEACACPRLRVDQNYLLVGQKGLKFTRRNGEQGFKYVFGVGSMVEFWPKRVRPRNALRIQKLNTLQTMLVERGCANEN